MTSTYKRVAKAMMIAIVALLTVTMTVEPVAAGVAPAALPITYTCTGNQADDIVGIALTQVGYIGAYKNGKKYSAYGDWYNSSKPTGAWCAKFVSWCAYKAGISTSIVPKTSISYDYKTSGKGIYHDKSGYTPKKGDLVLYHYPSGADRPVNHVGIVREDAKYKDGVLTILTVEGNVLNNDTNNKGKVCRLARHSNTANDQYKYIVGFVTPKYNTIVTYNANGGSGAPAKQTKAYGKTITLSSTIPTRSGYTFRGWATSASASSPSYYPGSSYSANAKLELYACWKKNTTNTGTTGGSGSSGNSGGSSTGYSGGSSTGNSGNIGGSSTGYNSGTNTGSGTNYGQTQNNNQVQAVNTSKGGQNKKTNPVISHPGKAPSETWIKGVRLTKITKGKGRFTVKWKRAGKKQLKQFTGYEIQFSTRHDFSKNVKTKSTTKKKASKVVIRKLKKKTNYYVRVRRFRKMGGKTVYSNWSNVKKVRTK